MIKKFLLGVTFALTFSQWETYAQADKKALIEVFTNSHCSICPSMYTGLSTYVKSNEINKDVVYIFYHVNTYNDDPLYQETKAESLPRAQFYNVTGTPSAALNGTIQDRTYSEYPSRISNAIQQSQDIQISLEGTLQNNGLTLQVSTDKEIPNNASLYVIVTEDIQYKGRNGISEHTNVMRKMLTGIGGTVPDSKTGTLFSANLSFTDLNTRDINKAAVVCFLQNNSTKEIYQVTRKSISAFITSSTEETGNSDISVYPNPSLHGCTIELPDTGLQTLDICTIHGEKIQTVHSSAHSNQGKIQYYWNGSNSDGNSVPKGVYFVRGKDFIIPVIIK